MLRVVAAECGFSGCHSAECHDAQCHGARKNECDDMMGERKKEPLKANDVSLKHCHLSVWARNTN